MKRFLSMVTLVLPLALMPACTGEQKPPNVLLISIDTLRPDRLGCYGHDRNTSPTIDALARRGVLFENAYSVAGWTLPAMATIMTGRYPRDHGATDFHWSINPGLPTMAGKLRRAGYDTRGYVSHVILQPRYGIADGFKSYDYSVLRVGHPHDVATAKRLTDIAIRDIPDLEEPFFVWMHYFDPHFRYMAHDPWRSFGDEEIDRYDQEIAQTDAQVGRLLDKLGKKMDNTIVIFTSDHGEEFGEHDYMFHYTLYEEVMRVPLVIAAPSLAPRVVQEPVEQVDLLPTLYSLLDIDPGVLPGRDILAVHEGERAVFFERDRPPPYNQRGVLLGDYKLFVIEEADTARIPVGSRGTYVPITNVHPGTYMYDLTSDPAEKNNIYDESDAHARRMLVMLAEHFSTGAAPAHELEIDDTLRQKLRSLGYIK